MSRSVRTNHPILRPHLGRRSHDVIWGVPVILAEQQLPAAVVIKVTLTDDKCHLTRDTNPAKR
jgi:hypothetical protein